MNLSIAMKPKPKYIFEEKFLGKYYVQYKMNETIAYVNHVSTLTVSKVIC